ncbi:CPBP family intramembrane metalloprotease [Duganella sp. FT135W]|uniref:CPBP family intramembrane metalloprotease n=1 Tax=Duganella flavida TaxID=2692175 RepID=A0A6L8K733_9BURK|nr:CPBP family intramembrane glutamic endopeptidase [Duganella flavida]MYM23303.1 CPBP family intramembrane metalloprotease [Duganella flavida]
MSTTQQVIPSVPSFRNRFFSHPITRMVLGVIATLGPITITMILANILIPKQLRAGGWTFLLAAAMSLLSYRWFVRRTEQRHTLAELALPGAAREAGAGIALGAILGLIVAGLLALAGAFSITSSNDWTIVLKTLPEQVMVAIFEELIFRAVLFRITEQRWGTRAALVSSFILFALAHMPNEGISVLAVVITGVAGVTLSAAYLLTRRLWLPIGLHFGWNYLFDGVFAVPVSGHAARGWLQVSMPGPDWLSGGHYGVEASAATLIVWATTTLILLHRARQK